jgi:alpha-ketoglutarate-dependent taurine dioxygenase
LNEFRWKEIAVLTLSADPQAWRADTLDEPARWYHPLSGRSLAALDEAVDAWRREPRPVTDVRPSAVLRGQLAEELVPVRAALETGRGFVILTGLPDADVRPDEDRLRYWLIGHVLGRPFEQNVQGTLLYDVRDTGQDVAYGARFSVTNAESTFHTDNSFGDTVLDYVGLLCLQEAKSGGLSQVVSGRAVYHGLLAEAPDVVEELGRPFHFDRRGGVRPGEAPTVRFPILERQRDDLLYRYLRYWIEAGHQKANEPLKPAQTRALDRLDGWLGRRELRAEFLMRRGEMFFMNNRWLLHNRTAFEDHAEPERRRHYVRLWLRRAE